MGEKFLLSPAELELSEQNNQGFKKTYQEIELIQEYFAPAKKDEPDSVFMTTTHIKEAIELGYSNRKLTIPMIAKALRELGFVRCAKHDTRTQQAIRGFYVFELKKNSI